MRRICQTVAPPSGHRPEPQTATEPRRQQGAGRRGTPERPGQRGTPRRRARHPPGGPGAVLGAYDEALPRRRIPRSRRWLGWNAPTACGPSSPRRRRSRPQLIGQVALPLFFH